MQTNDIDRFRSWALAALYASMSVLALLLVLAASQFWSSMQDGSTNILFLGTTGAITSALSAHTSYRFVSMLRKGERPKLNLIPFLFMALTLFAASNLFANL